MRRVIRGLVALAALAVILVAADLAARSLVLDRVGEELQSAYALPERPRITVAGGSFLLQAIRGRYDDVDVDVDSWPGQVDLSDVEVSIPTVEAPAGLVLGRTETIRLAEGHVSALVGYADLSRLASQSGTDVTVTPAGRDLQASSGFEVLGQRLDLAVTVTPEVLTADGRPVVQLTPRTAQIAGREVSLSQVRRYADRVGLDVLDPVQVPLDGVPPQVSPRSLEVTPDGVVVRGVLEATSVAAGS